MFKKILDFFIFSNILIGLGTVCLSYETLVLLRLQPLACWQHILIFSGSVAYYALHDLLDPNESGIKGKWLRSHKFITALCFILFGLTALCLGIFLKNWILISALFFAFGGILYFFRLMPFKHLKRFKDKGFFKTISLSFFWVLVTVALPVMIQMPKILFSGSFIPVAIHRFLLITATAILFDVRDLKEDSQKNINTLPMQLGNKTSLVFLFILILYVLNFFIFFSKIEALVFLANTVLAYVLGYFILVRQQNKYWQFASVDALFVVQPLMLYFVTNYFYYYCSKF